MNSEQGDWAVLARGLVRRFGKTPAVDGLDLAVSRGQIYGIVGPDGAGKTTTMRILCGALVPDAGDARVAGHDVVQEPERVKERIGYLSQQFAMYAHLTVWENIRFTADLFEVPEGEWQENAERLLQASRMTPFKDRLASDLSGGMKQKLALTCALVHTPEVIFLDEPTTGVDPISRRDFWHILYDLPRRGVTVIVSTPYMDEAERCQRLTFMLAGKAIAEGTPEAIKAGTDLEVIEVQAHPLNAVRRLIAGMPGVIEVAVFGTSLHVLVHEAHQRCDELEASLQEPGVEILTCRPMPMSLEDAFLALSRQARREPVAADEPAQHA
jgi:ABC-2 type transport system ATP-binding protein